MKWGATEIMEMRANSVAKETKKLGLRKNLRKKSKEDAMILSQRGMKNVVLQNKLRQSIQLFLEEQKVMAHVTHGYVVNGRFYPL